MKKLLFILSLGILSNVAFANQEQPNKEARREKVEQVKKELMQKKVGLESESHQERIAILQKADSCIKGAKSREEYKACEQQEKQSRENLKEKMKSKHENLKQEVQQKRQQLQEAKKHQ
jgi:hypothetical protein